MCIGVWQCVYISCIVCSMFQRTNLMNIVIYIVWVFIYVYVNSCIHVIYADIHKIIVYMSILM